MKSSQKNKRAACESTLAVGLRYPDTDRPLPVIARDNANLASKIADIDAARVQPQRRRSKGATKVKTTAQADTRGLEALFDAADAFLNRVYDPAVNGLAEKAPVFVAEYFAARQIIDRGGAHATPVTSSETAQPAAPAAA